MLFAFHWLAVAQNTTLHLNEGMQFIHTRINKLRYFL